MPDFPEPPPRWPLLFIRREYDSLEVRWMPIRVWVQSVFLVSGSGMTGVPVPQGQRHYVFKGLTANADYRVVITECAPFIGCQTVVTQEIYTRPPHRPLRIARLLSDATESGVRIYWLRRLHQLEPVAHRDRLRLQLGKRHQRVHDEYDYLSALYFLVGANSHFFDFTTVLHHTYMLRCVAWVDLDGGSRNFKNESRWLAPERRISLGGYTERSLPFLDLQTNEMFPEGVYPAGDEMLP